VDVATVATPAEVGVPRRVAVASNLRLLEETVAAALAGVGHRTARIPWPRPETESEPVTAEVVVIVFEAVGEKSVDAVRTLLEGSTGRSLVVVGTRPGPLWGALVDAGADAVLPATISIEELLEAIEALARGDEVLGFVERQGLLRQWFAARAAQIAYRSQLERLTQREREVLELLHAGYSATMIAVRLGVSETTVRSQIRAVLRKLGVRSQLAAVAVLDGSRAEFLTGEE
jgi:two-component system, NarL family, nitrate/nitrite response regulator NarL